MSHHDDHYLYLRGCADALTDFAVCLHLATASGLFLDAARLLLHGAHIRP